jgi:hypothetical protein
MSAADPALASRALLIKDAGRRQRRMYLYIATTPMTFACVRALPLPYHVVFLRHVLHTTTRIDCAAIDGPRRRRLPP